MPTSRIDTDAIAFGLLFGVFIAFCGLLQFGAAAVLYGPVWLLPGLFLGGLFSQLKRLQWAPPVSGQRLHNRGTIALVLSVLILFLSCLAELKLRSTEIRLPLAASVESVDYDVFGPRTFVEYHLASDVNVETAFGEYGADLVRNGWVQRKRVSEPSYEYGVFERGSNVVVMESFPGLGNQPQKRSIALFVNLNSPSVALIASLVGVATIIFLGFRKTKT